MVKAERENNDGSIYGIQNGRGQRSREGVREARRHAKDSTRTGDGRMRRGITTARWRAGIPRDPGRQERRVVGVASDVEQLIGLLVVGDQAGRGARRLDQRSFTVTTNPFGDISDLQLKIQVQAVIDPQLEA